MIFGGLHKTSLIDYPGKVSCVLFTSGCNFACPFCHNPDLARSTPRTIISLDEIIDFLEARRHFLDGVVVTGGEPTLHADLHRFLARVKAMGYAVKLDTNGSRPAVLADILTRELADYVAMDIKTLPEAYPEHVKAPCDGETIRSSVRKVMALAKDYEFRTTCVAPLIDEDIIAAIAGIIRGSPLWVLQPCLPKGVLCPEFFDDRGRVYSTQDLARFQSIAAPWVGACVVRP